MRTSLNEIKETEDFLLGKAPVGNRLLMQARLVIDPEFRQKVNLQKKVYDLVRVYARKKWKEEMERSGRRLLNDPGKQHFREEINKIFS